MMRSVVASASCPCGPGDLVARIRRGDERAFDTMFREHYAALCDFATTFVNAPDVAEDIVQAVFVNVWRARAAWMPRGGVRAYLFGACRNGALDYLRHRHTVDRLTYGGALSGVTFASAPTPADEEVEAVELGNRLRRAVAQLPERRRLVVELRLTRQLTNREIALQLGISIKGVETQFTRALSDLRRRMSSSESARPTWV